MLINDIEFRANRNTPSKRRVVLKNFRLNQNPIALISQQTSFFSDLSVRKFLQTHAQVRKKDGSAVKQTIDLANQLVGERINPNSSMTALSGGQTRALLITDAVVIGDSPLLLLDEIENAGINKLRALDVLKKYKKIFVFVTHDPRIFLASDLRIVMRNGMMQKIIRTTPQEKRIYGKVKQMDNYLFRLREKVRNGETLVL